MARVLQFKPREKPRPVPQAVLRELGLVRYTKEDAKKQITRIECVIEEPASRALFDPLEVRNYMVGTLLPCYSLENLIREIVESCPEEWRASPNFYRAAIHLFAERCI